MISLRNDPFLGNINRYLDGLVKQALHENTCDWSGEFGDCMLPATVHHLASERDLCLRHFGMAVALGHTSEV
jgi:hypothetical protein